MTIHDDETNQPTSPVDLRKAPIGRLVKIAYTHLHSKMDGMLRPLGLSFTQWSALVAIHSNLARTHSDLEQFLLVEGSSVTSLIQGMERKGLIYRREHPVDARIKLIYLTDEGRKAAETYGTITGTIDESVNGSFTEEERREFRHMLIKFIKAIK